jgi:hypothetical protein
MVNGVQGIWVESIGEGVINEKPRDRQQVQFVRILRAIALQRAEIVGVPEFIAEMFKDGPITLASLISDFTFQIITEIICDPIVVEEGVVHIE